MPANRSKTGRFVAGQSGNPSGRPKIPDDVKQATRAAGPEAIQLLVSVMKNKKEKTPYRIEAAKTLLDRGYGKPMQMQDINLYTPDTIDIDARIRRLILKEDTNLTVN